MRKAICDFCKGTPREKILPPNTSTPKGWLDFRILVRGTSTGFDRLMCEGCVEERKIKVSPHVGPTIADVILDELADGIHDIAQDAIGE